MPCKATFHSFKAGDLNTLVIDSRMRYSTIHTQRVLVHEGRFTCVLWIRRWPPPERAWAQEPGGWDSSWCCHDLLSSWFSHLQSASPASELTVVKSAWQWVREEEVLIRKRTASCRWCSFDWTSEGPPLAPGSVTISYCRPPTSPPLWISVGIWAWYKTADQSCGFPGRPRPAWGRETPWLNKCILEKGQEEKRQVCFCIHPGGVVKGGNRKREGEQLLLK